MLSKLHRSKSTSITKKEKGSSLEMRCNQEPQDNHTKTLIFSEPRPALQLSSQALPLQRSLSNREITIHSKVLHSEEPMNKSQKEHHQDLQCIAKMQNGRVPYSLVPLITFQQGNTSQRKVLEIKACGEMLKSSGKRKNHSLPL